MKSRKVWLVAALFYAVFSAPNATIIKIATQDINVQYWNVLRFLPIALIGLFFVVKAWSRIIRPGVWQRVIVSSMAMALAIILYTFAIDVSQASYVSIINLLIPIVVMVFSLLILKEKVSRRAVAGVTLAALGAAVLVIFPFSLAQGTTTFYPLATFLALLNCVCFGLAIVLMRQTNEHSDVPLLASVGVTAVCVVILSLGIAMVSGDISTLHATPSLPVVAAALYSGVGVALVARIIGIKLLEKLGSASLGAIQYLEILLALIIPVVVLGERLSITMVIGGILILTGLYVVEHHKRIDHRIRFVWRHH